MILQIYKFFNKLEEIYDTNILLNQYNSSSPVRHIIIDNFLPQEIFNNVCNEIEYFPKDKWISKTLGTASDRKEARDFSESYVLGNVFYGLTSHGFIEWIEKIVNQTGIISDPHHLGSGITSTPTGTDLGLHVDFNWNNTLKLNRKFNLIIYANPEWNDSWNGELEFWNKEATECLYTVKPKPNRLILWEYEQDLVHGFSKKLECPDNIARQNLMTIYYNSNATPESQPHKSLFLN